MYKEISMSVRGIVHILGGGTFLDVAPHLSLAARGTGKTAKELARWFHASFGLEGYSVQTHLTRQADPLSDLVTPHDVEHRIDEILEDPLSKIIVMNCAMVDFAGRVVTENDVWIGAKRRLRTDDGQCSMVLSPMPKVIQKIRKTRKDIFLVGFKQTFGATADEQYLEGLKLLKKSSCNLVLANDGETRLNMVITPEQARYHETTDRADALVGLVDMTILRHLNGTFTRSTVIEGEQAVEWNSWVVPEALRQVVDYCRASGAYKPFLGSTVGHFAVNLGGGKFLTSIRKSDFNQLDKVGLVAVEALDDNEVKAYGFRPSVGGQSQRIIFREHPDLDCIVHFHSKLRPGSVVKVTSQRPYECGSHQCGSNTSRNLTQYADGVWAVMLDQHGPNIVFNRRIDPQKVIAFIEANWDLASRTDDVDAQVAKRYTSRDGRAETVQ